MTEYTIADVSAGDRVTLEHDDGSKLVREFHADSTYAGAGWVVLSGEVNGFRYSIDSMLELGWRLTDVVKPEPALPTEPGRYRAGVSYDDEYRYFMLDPKGSWWDIGNSKVPDEQSRTAVQVAKYGPLTRLAPVPETAKAVLDRLASELGAAPRGYLDQCIATVADEFGVTLPRQGDKQ